MKKRSLSFVVFVVAIIGIPLWFYLSYQKPSRPTLEEYVKKALDGARGNYSIVIKNLKTGEEYSKSSHEVYQAGSLYKLWVMAEVFDQIENGQIAEDEMLTEDIAVLNETFHIASDSAELTAGAISLSVKDALRQMITISHNYAALLLSKRVGLSRVKLFLENNKLSESRVSDGPPVSSAHDIALFFQKLYNGEFGNRAYSEKMLDLLKAQQFNDKLPKYLPKNTVVAHKTGEIDYLTHDGGIVYAKTGDYIIVVLSESDSPPAAEDRIARISKAAYIYFSQENSRPN